MAKRNPFEASDIGGNILPILTEGLYRDPLDAIREYIQNAIDAESSEIKIASTLRTVTITDNGNGMDRETANNARKLGVSRKDPTKHVGFRGIGIYSGYNLAGRIEIYTKTKTDQIGSLITFDFKKMREMLGEEELARAAGTPHRLFLEELLTETVQVGDDPDGMITDQGTMVMLGDIRTNVSKRINNYQEVKHYLQSTVPLPFNPDFIFAETLTRKLSDFDYRTLSISLDLRGKKERLYKPYYTTMFANNGRFEPEVDEIVTDEGTHYGVVWTVYNDARRVLSDVRYRGILVTKQGFTISNRTYLSRYFPREVLYKRLTGEVIIQNDDLRPNAARSDFESTDKRAEFLFSLQKVIKKVTQRGDDLQEEMKAREVLALVGQSALRINQKLTSIANDTEQLLLAHTQLTSDSRDLAAHPFAQVDNPDLYKKTQTIIIVALKFIKSTLEAKRKSTAAKAHKRKEPVLRARKEAEKERVSESEEQGPRSILDLIGMLDISSADQFKIVLDFIDENILIPRLEDAEYLEEINSLREYLEEVL